MRLMDEDLSKLKDKLLCMGLLVERAVENCATALFKRDSGRAEQVIKNDQEINLYEIEIDELGHEIIARYQPTAVDLRLITMVLKMTSDLERMGDQAVNIAQQAMKINREPPLKPYEDLPEMARQVQRMVRDALDAFVEKDLKKAQDILERDDDVDAVNDKVYEDVQKVLQDKPKHIRTGVSLIMVSHNFERIADLATNIAEDVIYLKRGIDIRHHIRERREEST